ncbi:hypothetical protein QBC41DRAFT_392099, partial [Cercophora samala]
MPRKEQTLHVGSLDHDDQFMVDPRGLAPAWAETRTDLIESLPLFSQTQQGIYQYDKIMRGALLDGYGGEHTHFDDDIIITKLDGGGDISVNGHMRHSTSRLEAAQRAKDEQSSIGLIIGSNARNIDLRIVPPKPCRYAVLGEYVLVDLWHEYQGGGDAIVTVARYQRREFLQPPWWKNPNMTSANYRDQKQRQVQIVNERKPTRSKVCTACGEPSPKRYKVWVCANPRCEEFSTRENGEPLSKDTSFSIHWLLERVESTADTSGLDFAPSRLKRPTQPTDMRKGSVCPKCRKCVSRFHWASWVCEGPYGCGYEVSLPVKIPELQSLLTERSRAFAQTRHPFHSLHEPQNLQREFVSQGTTFIEYQHEMPGGGVVTLLKSRPPRTATPGTIFDDLFNSITWEANHGSQLDLERHLAQNWVPGSRINRYEISFGEREDPDASPPLKALENAPASVQTVLEILRDVLEASIQDKRAKDVAKRKDPWVLTVTAYVGGDQKEGFKPAGYNTQGDFTATLCLGSPARLRWRYSPVYWHHREAGEVLEGSPLPDTKHFEALQQLKGRNLPRGEYEAQKQEILDGSGGQPGRRIGIPTYLTADLTHGDILITQGDAIGTHFDSAVEPQGLLHIRLTAFRAQDGDSDGRGRGSTSSARRSASRSQSRTGSTTRARKTPRASSRARRTQTPEISTPSRRGTRGSSRTRRASSRVRRGSSTQREKGPKVRKEESPTRIPVRLDRKSTSRQTSQTRNSASPEPSTRPRTTRVAAKEARAVKSSSDAPLESSSDVFIASSSDVGEQISNKWEKQAPLTRETLATKKPPAPKSILKRTTIPTPDTTSKIRPKAPEESTLHQPSLSSAVELPHLSGRQFVYQPPPKTPVISFKAGDPDHVETISHPCTPTTKPTEEVNTPGLSGRPVLPFPVPPRQNPRPATPPSILKPATPAAVRSTRPSIHTLPWEIYAQGIPVPPTFQTQSPLKQPGMSQVRKSVSGIADLCPIPQPASSPLPCSQTFPATQHDQERKKDTVTSNPKRLSPAESNSPLSPPPPDHQAKVMLRPSQNCEVVSISSGPPSPAPEPQPKPQKQVPGDFSCSPSSSDDDNGASYKVSPPRHSSPASRQSLWTRLWGS